MIEVKRQGRQLKLKLRFAWVMFLFWPNWNSVRMGDKFRFGPSFSLHPCQSTWRDPSKWGTHRHHRRPRCRCCVCPCQSIWRDRCLSPLIALDTRAYLKSCTCFLHLNIYCPRYSGIPHISSILDIILHPSKYSSFLFISYTNLSVSNPQFYSTSILSWSACVSCPPSYSTSILPWSPRPCPPPFLACDGPSLAFHPLPLASGIWRPPDEPGPDCKAKFIHFRAFRDWPYTSLSVVLSPLYHLGLYSATGKFLITLRAEILLPRCRLLGHFPLLECAWCCGSLLSSSIQSKYFITATLCHGSRVVWNTSSPPSKSESSELIPSAP